uniref:Uncharacterized protein n=1 Tax=Helianthus annuus TaxID=4232 RepID=A0A251U295_HELAN
MLKIYVISSCSKYKAVCCSKFDHFLPLLKPQEERKMKNNRGKKQRMLSVACNNKTKHNSFLRQEKQHLQVQVECDYIKSAEPSSCGLRENACLVGSF